MSPDANNKWVDKHILKVADDHEPIEYYKKDDDSSDKIFSSINGKEFSILDFRNKIEPWLTALFQSDHFSLFVGAGLSYSLKKIADVADNNVINIDKDKTPMGKNKFSVFGDLISKAAAESAIATERSIDEVSIENTANFEDQIRVANEIYNGIKHFSNDKIYFSSEMPALSELKKDIEKILEEFIQTILLTENSLAISKEYEKVFKYLMNFLVSFASRAGTRERLNIFTTNYDRIIEFGADVAGIRLLDRFVGALNPVFRSSRLNIDMHYNPPGIRGEPRFLEGVAHFTKLHGSLDWMYKEKYVRKIPVPFGTASIKPFLPQQGNDFINATSVIIYPNSAKDRETSEYPYVELFRDFASAVCQPNSTLVIYGYSFGDEHINRIIRDMLIIPSTHIVIITYNDDNGRISKFFREVNKPSQISLLIGNHFADFEILIDHYLPKPAIDRSTIKMAELLRARGIDPHIREDDTKPTQNDGI